MAKAKTVDELKAELAKEKKRGDLHFKNWKAEVAKSADAEQTLQIERGKHSAELKQVTTAGDQWKKLAEERTGEINGLRSIVRDLELTVERHRGYQDGIIDGQPPAMVPEQRELRRATWPYPQSEVFDPIGHIGSARTQYGSQKPWWHK